MIRCRFDFFFSFFLGGDCDVAFALSTSLSLPDDVFVDIFLRFNLEAFVTSQAFNSINSKNISKYEA